MRSRNIRNAARFSSVRVVACLGLVGCCLALALAGCSSTGKKSPSAAAAPAARPAAAPPPAATGPVAAATAPRDAVPVSSITGILAGRVVDSFSHRPPPTYIQVVLVPDSGGPAGAPIDV